MDCIFCKIISNQIPSYTIYEDEYTKCFLDINATSIAHTLVVPKKHIKDLYEMNNEDLCHIYDSVRKVMDIISKTFNTKGIRLVQNNGIFQEIKHYHMHIVTDIKMENITVEEVYNKLKKNC